MGSAMNSGSMACAVDIEAFYAARRPAPAEPDQLLLVSFDGKGIVMNPSALREATARAAARSRRKLSTRLSAREKYGRKPMAELAAVYDAVPAPRTAADVIGRPEAGGPAAAKPRRGPAAAGKWLSASVVDDVGQVMAAGFDEAARRDPDHQRTWVVLVDGNHTQLDAITAQAAAGGVTVHIVCDLCRGRDYADLAVGPRLGRAR
jgi:hypothetical protein